MSSQPDSGGAAEVRWASRVNPSLLHRLYENDARGLVDEELIDKVGFGLYARCQSILQVTEAHERGRVTCPRCEHASECGVNGTHRLEPGALVICDQCAWSVRWGDYVKTYQHKHLAGGGAVAFFEAFIEQFSLARSPREKLLAIDRLIHTFHWELVQNPGRSAARELIYARNTVELLTFLDTLTYGEGSTPDLCERKADWDRKLDRSQWHRMMGYRPDRDRRAGD
jgi:hypothetical protein